MAGWITCFSLFFLHKWQSSKTIAAIVAMSAHSRLNSAFFFWFLALAFTRHNFLFQRSKHARLDQFKRSNGFAEKNLTSNTFPLHLDWTDWGFHVFHTWNQRSNAPNFRSRHCLIIFVSLSLSLKSSLTWDENKTGWWFMKDIASLFLFFAGRRRISELVTFGGDTFWRVDEWGKGSILSIGRC